MDIIHLLSDHLANQIAAGEVIQRPASAVKELMENAIDAGATEIQLILKDAGKELIQVIDNGKGMSPADARMSFERHATSKIRDINDLFAIRTMGFRGEALASIAAVAHVELKTRPADQPVGTRILIEGTEVKLQEPAATSAGSNILVKNLFFNVPARRHFLKSNTTELRHVVDEFTRITMANPDISFKMIHNGVEQFHLQSGNLKARIVGLLGGSSEKNLVPVNEETEFLTIRGFIGKPNVATRTRGNQFFFINNRFIRNAYLNHAVTTAYEGLLAKDSFPFYVLFLETDPARVDVNVHPTKQEVKFEDDRLMYAYLQAAVKHALAKHNIAPSLDFTLNPEIQSLSSVQLPQSKQDQERVQGGYLSNSFADRNQAHRLAPSNDLKQWKELYKIAEKDADVKLPAAQIEIQLPSKTNQDQTEVSTDQRFNESTSTILSIQGSLLATTVKSGIMLIHLRRAQERIWHQRLSDSFVDHAMPSQQLLYPVNMELPPAAATILAATLPELQEIGFDISHFGGNSFVVQGVPAGVTPGLAKELIESIVDRLSHENPKAADLRKELLLNTLAFKLSYGTPPSGNSAQQALIDELFACDNPEYTPGGKKVFRVVTRDELDKLLM